MAVAVAVGAAVAAGTDLAPVAARAAGRGAGVTLGLLLGTCAAFAEERRENSAMAPVAVVVGNQDYEALPDLDNAGADASRVAEMLRGFGYEVFHGTDLDKEGFEDLLREAALNVRDGGRVFFYYAGHGIQLGSRNYLLTTNATFTDPADLPFQAVTLDQVTRILAARAGEQVYMLDSCRENPVIGTEMQASLTPELYEAREGFEVVKPPMNTLVAFSTTPGAVAFDGVPGGHSPYTEAVVKNFEGMPGADALNVLRRVRADVLETTARKQVTWESSTLTDALVLNAGEVAEPAPAMAEAPAPAETPAPAAPASSGPVEVSVSRPLDRIVPLDDALLPALAGAESVEVASAERGTAEVARAEDGTWRVTYAPRLSQTPAADAGGHEGRVSLVLAGPSGESVVDVQLSLPVDACDIEAGDHLDLQGSGVFRYPDQIEPAAAERACRAATAEAPGEGRFAYQLGRALQAQGRLEEAYEAFESASELGHVRADHARAFLHTTPGIDRAAIPIPEDPALAAELWERAIAAGDPFAMHSYGKRLLREGATEAERRRGFDLLNTAMELGHTYAMNEMGSYFLYPPDGAGAPQPARAEAHYRASHERDDIYGTDGLAYVALNRPEPDFATAALFFRDAAAKGHPTAPSSMGRLMLRGQVDGTPREALDWFDMALARGDGWGGANGAMVIATWMPEMPAHEAAVRAAKAAVLSDPAAAEDALARLSEMDAGTLDRAAQAILRDLGETGLAVDGDFGGRSNDALLRQAARLEVGMPVIGGPLDRVLFAARLHFAENPPRVDLF